MFSPQEQQIEICLLKSNLEKIENDLISQRSALPALAAENEQKYRDTMTALRVARSLAVEIERLKLQNVRLSAKRMQLKKQCEDLSKALEKARENRSELLNLLQQEEDEIELYIRKYEDNLREKADQFRKTRSFYDEVAMRNELKKIDDAIMELEGETTSRQKLKESLRTQLEDMKPLIPDDLFQIVGKNVIEDRVKDLTAKYEALSLKRNQMMANKK